jgi:hypothetical protein
MLKRDGAYPTCGTVRTSRDCCSTSLRAPAAETSNDGMAEMDTRRYRRHDTEASDAPTDCFSSCVRFSRARRPIRVMALALPIADRPGDVVEPGLGTANGWVFDARCHIR